MTKYLRLKFGSLSKAFDATNADDLDGGVIGVRQQNADLRKMFSTFFIDLLLDVDEIEKSGFKFSDMKTIYSQNAVPVCFCHQIFIRIEQFESNFDPSFGLYQTSLQINLLLFDNTIEVCTYIAGIELAIC